MNENEKHREVAKKFSERTNYGFTHQISLLMMSFTWFFTSLIQIQKRY